MDKVRIRPNRRPSFAYQVEFRVAIRTTNSWRQIGVECLLVDPDRALRRIKGLLLDKFRLNRAWVVGLGGRGGFSQKPNRIVRCLRIR